MRWRRWGRIFACGVCAVCTPHAAFAQRATLRDLPITEFPSTGPDAPTLALMMTGDGGWAALDTRVATYLAARGIAVVGINMRSYLSRARAPDSVAADCARVLRAYLSAWHRERVIIVGYSRGADIAPFVVARLAADLRARVTLVAMLGPATNANFEFHFIDLVRNVKRDSDRPTAPEIERLRGTRMLCVYGADEDDSACPHADTALVMKLVHKGGHRIDRDFDGIAESILRAIPR